MTISEWDYRQLCPDGSCIGLIGSDGTCKVCGRAAPNWGDERQRGMVAPQADEADEADDSNEADQPARRAESTQAPGGWTDRQLCSDGGCIGVIGSDGRCTVCGTPAADRDDEADEDDEDDEDLDDDADLEGDVDGDGDVDDDDRALLEAADHLARTTSDAPEDAVRALCPDGACVGVIGPDGHCNLCGKAAA